MLTVYHLRKSRSERILWLLEELGLVEPGALGPMVKEEVARIVRWVDADMAERAFAAGDEFTAADVMLASALEAAKARGHLGGTAHLAPYLERMTARPACQRAKQKAA